MSEKDYAKRTTKAIEHVSQLLSMFADQEITWQEINTAMRGELSRYLMYLSASDGMISWKEADYIGKLRGEILTPNEIGKTIRQENIYSTQFENTVPQLMKLAVTIDTARGNDPHVSQIMIDLYKLIGMGLIGTDSDDVANIADDRFTDFRIYINMLEEYRDIELFGESRSDLQCPRPARWSRA